ncbi:MAG: DUF167 domain-containing protein [Patescibacteria group bacterium]|nr:DUF167 domain-containing protein [Patescibacteria group bacterium]MDD5121520.1 DUF167 domain-containing protein [Patescibacteria group bacterium]MDD5221850.1 DUF167 domain-containing protein [Patescibacteria group bacterium]MDD5396317.1 DUF167 domain-containing protein [Patescibacteria group bacterium]
MKILVKVKPGVKKNEVMKIGECEYVVFTNAPAKQGKANQAVIKLLSEYFKIPASRISIAIGHKTKSKIIEIN